MKEKQYGRIINLASADERAHSSKGGAVMLTRIGYALSSLP